MDNLNDLLKGKFVARPGDYNREVLQRLIFNGLLSAAALQRVIAVEQRAKEGIVDDDKVNDEFVALIDQLVEQTNKDVNSLLADWELRSDKPE